MGSEKARSVLLHRQMDLDVFLGEVTKVAEENVENGKDPQLTKEQYEQVKTKLSPEDKEVIKILDKSILELIDGYPPFFMN